MGLLQRLQVSNRDVERTRMGHVDQRTRRISLDPHVLGSGQPSKGEESTRLGNLRLVII